MPFLTKKKKNKIKLFEIHKNQKLLIKTKLSNKINQQKITSKNLKLFQEIKILGKKYQP